MRGKIYIFFSIKVEIGGAKVQVTGQIIGHRSHTKTIGHWTKLFWTDVLLYKNKTPKVVSVGCVGPWKHNGVLYECGKIRETGKMCHVMSTQSTISS